MTQSIQIPCINRYCLVPVYWAWSLDPICNLLEKCTNWIAHSRRIWVQERLGFSDCWCSTLVEKALILNWRHKIDRIAPVLLIKKRVRFEKAYEESFIFVSNESPAYGCLLSKAILSSSRSMNMNIRLHRLDGGRSLRWTGKGGRTTSLYPFASLREIVGMDCSDAPSC